MAPRIFDIISMLEQYAPLSLQESYDNAGLITGDPAWECRGITVSLDATEAVIQEAIDRKHNMVVAHHPIVFSGLKKINGKNYVERAVILAIKNDIAIYAIHTNLDNVVGGVSGRMASMLGLQGVSVLAGKPATLQKLVTFVPSAKAAGVRDAIFAAGAGSIGNYSECSFNTLGEGTFKAGEGTNPFVGQVGERHSENEIRIEAVMPAHLRVRVVEAMKVAHPYEEVAFDVFDLANANPLVGSGVIGEVVPEISEREFLERLRSAFHLELIRHTELRGRPVKRVALCGGAGSFLISNALSSKADFFVTADLKYHEFFDAEGKMVLADIGHYESEQWTIGLLQELLEEKFPTFAVLKTAVKTNPVRYFS
jgi:dinuclear metal center YbgI/SA1388 family protein